MKKKSLKLQLPFFGMLIPAAFAGINSFVGGITTYS